MNANFQNIISKLASVNPAMIPAVMAVQQASGDDAAINLAQQFMGGAVQQQPSAAQSFQAPVPMQVGFNRPVEYRNMDRVLVPWDGGEIFQGSIIGRDVDPRTRGVRGDFYIVCLFAPDNKNAMGNVSSFDGMDELLTSFPIDLIFPDTDGGRLAALAQAQQELKKKQDKDGAKVQHRLAITAGFPYTEEALRAMKQNDKVTALSILGLSPFAFTGDRVPVIMEHQGAWVKEHKAEIEAAKATLPRETVQAAPTPVVPAKAPVKPTNVKLPVNKAAAAKVEAKQPAKVSPKVAAKVNPKVAAKIAPKVRLAAKK